MRRIVITAGAGALACLLAAVASSKQGTATPHHRGPGGGGTKSTGAFVMPSQPVSMAGILTGSSAEDRFLLLVTYPDENLVRVFNEAGQVLSQEPSVLEPLGIAAGSAGVYVGSGKDGRVDVFKVKGKKLSGPVGALGVGNGEFLRPVAIAISPLGGQIYVADVKREDIRIYDPLTLKQVGSVGVGTINSPCGLAFDSQGVLFASDMMEGYVRKYQADGTYVGKFTQQGKYPGQTVRPIGITVDDLGQVYVVDAYFGRVQLYAPTGTWIGNIGAIGAGPGLMRTPLNAVLHPITKTLYVSDSTDFEVEAFAPGTGQ